MQRCRGGEVIEHDTPSALLSGWLAGSLMSTFNLCPLHPPPPPGFIQSPGRPSLRQHSKPAAPSVTPSLNLCQAKLKKISPPRSILVHRQSQIQTLVFCFVLFLLDIMSVTVTNPTSRGGCFICFGCVFPIDFFSDSLILIL